jgi:type I restriction enzyme S subunit
MILRFADERMNPDYFATYFGSAAAQRYLAEAATGTIMPNINPKVLSRMPIPVAARDDQDRFVARCDAFDQSRRATETELAALVATYQAALAEWIGMP